MKTMKALHSIFWTAGLCLSLLSCGEDEEPVVVGPDTPVGLDFHLTVEDEDGTVPEGDVHWLVFGEDDCLTAHVHSTSVKELCETYRPEEPGRYLYILAVSADEEALPDLLPLGMPVDDAFRMLTTVQESNPGLLLSGWKRTVVEEGSLNACTIRVQEELAQPATLRLYLRLPEMQTVHTRSTAGNLRCVAEAYDPETGLCVLHRSFFPTAGVGTQTCEVALENLEPLNYDFLFWCDYVPGMEATRDHCYVTSSLKSVAINDTVPYVAGDDSRRAYYLHYTTDLATKANVTQQAVTMDSPFATYSVTGADEQKYEEMQGVNDLPGWQDIEVQGTYNGFFPCAFDVWDGVPVDARTGQTFTARAAQTPEGKIILFSDYVFAGGDQASFTSVSFDLLDSRTGEVFSQVDEVIVDYVPGQSASVSGDYLTAGVFSDGVGVDDRWDGELDVEF